MKTKRAKPTECVIAWCIRDEYGRLQPELCGFERCDLLELRKVGERIVRVEI